MGNELINPRPNVEGNVFLKKSLLLARESNGIYTRLLDTVSWNQNLPILEQASID